MPCRAAEHLELVHEDLRIAAVESHAGSVAANADEDHCEGDGNDAPKRKPQRRPRVSENTPRQRRELDPGTFCPDCGGDLRLVGEDISEMLDMVMAQLKVLQIARLKTSCRRSEKMVQKPARRRPIPGSMASAELLANILISKFDDHLPLL